jgi:DNA mismatch endonuclease (patch repair protein)
MVDRMTREQRSRTMSHIRSRDTGPELALRSSLWRKGGRGYRIHPMGVAGSPDIAYMGRKVAIFVDGCFWHRCPVCYREPSTNTEFWRLKMDRNVNRDRNVDSELAGLGWTVLRFWEHEIRDALPACTEKVKLSLGAVKG